jgi:two-component system NtrC family sensor kinase
MPEVKDDAPARAENAEGVIRAMERKLEDYERWFRVLDGQMKVLERERQKLAAVMNHSDAGFLVLDSYLRVTWANEVVTRQWGAGRHPQAVVGESCNRILCRCETVCESCPTRRAMLTGQVAHHEIRHEVDGLTRHIYATAMPLLSPQGAVEEAIVMLQDISDLEVLRRSREALRASEARFRTIFERSTAGISTVAADGTFLQVNPALCRFLGYDEQELLKMTVLDVTHPEDLEKSQRYFSDDESPRPSAIELEKRYIRKDGGVVWGRTSASWLADKDGCPAYSVSLTQDVTERKRLEEELRHAEKMSAVGQLVAGVAHELNNPLAGVMGFAQILLKRQLDEKVRRGLETISHEAERCRRIVQNLQTFARKQKPQVEHIGINGILENTLELRAYQLRVDNVRIVKDLDPELPRTMADFHQLRQVFLNIVVNAHQAIVAQRESGTLTIRTRRAGNEIEIEFEDDGPGIPPKLLSRIFDPFFSTKDVGQGAGLGLSICYGIVQEHRGRISARNAPGGGAILTIRLPIREPEARPVRSPAEDLDHLPEKAPPSNILVVDDELVIIDVLYQALRMDGHRVDTAINGATALRKMQAERYDLIISDLKMPGMSGQELYERISGEDPELARRIVFSTGDVVSSETRNFLERTGARYVQKPFEIDSIRSLVHDILTART